MQTSLFIEGVNFHHVVRFLVSGTDVIGAGQHIAFPRRRK
jgi:hypothetical protein